MKRIGVIFTILIIFLCISCVNAEDFNLTDINMTLNDTNTVDLLIDDNLNENSSHNHTKISSISDSPIKAATYSAPGGTFTQLRSIINSASAGSTIVISGDYYQDTSTRITINKNLVIEGNGYTLDAMNKSTVFYITAGRLELYNTTITQSRTTSANMDAAVYLYGSNARFGAYGCNFINNLHYASGSSSGHCLGVAVASNSFNWVDLVDCNFFNNSLQDYRTASVQQWSSRSIVCFIEGGGKSVWVEGCNFIDNSVISKAGGTVDLEIGGVASAYVNKCYFKNYLAYSTANNAYSRTSFSGSVRTAGSSVVNLNFTNNVFADNYGNESDYNPFSCGRSITSSYVYGDLNVYGNWFGNNYVLGTYDFAPLYGSTYGYYDNSVVLRLTNTTPFTSSSGSVSFIAEFYLFNYTDNTYTKFTPDFLNPLPINFTTNKGSVSPVSSTINNQITGTLSYSGGDGGYLSAIVESQVSTIYSSAGTFDELQKLIDATPTGGTLTLTKDYIFNTAYDLPYRNGMIINKSITIEGNGHTIDAQELNTEHKAHIFDIICNNVYLNNLNFKNAFYYLYEYTYDVDRKSVV